MSDLANVQTGEIYEPTNPVEIEATIIQLSDRIDRSVAVIKTLWEARYLAEREWIRIHAQAVIDSTAHTVTEKRAEADLVAMDARKQFDAAKATLHAAEALQQALRARLSGAQTLSRAVGQAYGATR